MPSPSRSRYRQLLLAGALLLAGCSSDYVKVTPPPGQYQKLGAAKGESCGTNFLLIPIGINERVQRAYDDAVASVPQARALVDVSMQDRWFWWGLGTVRCTTISGVGVR